jgi:hypothetical protein
MTRPPPFIVSKIDSCGQKKSLDAAPSWRMPSRLDCKTLKPAAARPRIGELLPG